ncbi:hypothetical protein H5410_023936 [Solanum commersonii]|uniref:Uncharacterized protein n=1 Tax=Solanum commersonii TaxID=4109 RepID=A0A9J5ZKJ7_SOLCO|nr:hypothetical protein H5410_023936 [Solanum commersonii]
MGCWSMDKFVQLNLYFVNSSRELCQPNVDDKCARPTSPQSCSKFSSNHSNTVEPTTSPSSIPKHVQASANSILHSSGVTTPLFLATLSCPARTSSVCPYDDTKHGPNELSPFPQLWTFKTQEKLGPRSLKY